MQVSLDWPALDIELSNLCQTSCLMCPRDAIKKRGLGVMKPETFTRIVKECKKFRIQNVAFCGLGEPLLNKHIFNYIKLLKQEINGIKISMVTNGVLLTAEIVQKLIIAGIDSISISLQALDPVLYSTLMPGLDYNQVIKNIHEAIAIAPPRLRIAVNFTSHKMNQHELETFKNYWRRYAQIRLNNMHTRGGYVNDERLMEPVTKNIITTRCKIFEGINFIAYDGRILSCCHDAQGDNVMGDVHINTFDEIRKNKLQIIREFKWFPICSGCTDILRNTLF